MLVISLSRISRSSRINAWREIHRTMEIKANGRWRGRQSYWEKRKEFSVLRSFCVSLHRFSTSALSDLHVSPASYYRWQGDRRQIDHAKAAAESNPFSETMNIYMDKPLTQVCRVKRKTPMAAILSHRQKAFVQSKRTTYLGQWRNRSALRPTFTYTRNMCTCYSNRLTSTAIAVTS